jgi:superfamily II DNA/RNA helicase
MSFSTLGLSPKVLEAVAAAGYTAPTAIQAEAIPHALARRDVLGLAQTGSGKTAAFVLPMLTLLEKGRARARMPRTLILEPTRELAMQVQEAFESLGRMHSLSVATLIGGVAFEPQAAKIDRGADVVIATPGRLLDHFERGKLLLTGVELLVIDEADRMLDMGFIPDIERICKLLPFTRQTLFFSATMPPEIQRLTAQFLHNPVQVETARVSSTAATISQFAVKCPSDPKAKRDALRKLIRSQSEIKNAIVFANRKTTVALLEKSLRKHGFNAAALHGDMDQTSRLRTLAAFRAQEVTFLIASDVAARGLDIPEVSHVFNFDVPIHSEDYVHRIGRTGRAGREGHAYMLVTGHDTKHFKAIEDLIEKSVAWFDIGTSVSDETEADHADHHGGRERVNGRGRRGERSGNRGDRGGDRGGRRSQRNENPVETRDAEPEIAKQGEQPVKAERAPRPAREERPAPAARQQERQPRRENRTEKRGEKGDDGPDFRGFDQGNMPAFLTRTTRA